MKLRGAESRAEDTDEMFTQIMWSAAMRLLTKLLFKEPVLRLDCRVSGHVRKHNKLVRIDIPEKLLTYSLVYFWSDIIIGLQIS